MNRPSPSRAALVTAGLLFALTCASARGSDDVLRCGGALVTVGMIAAQVVAKCGEPKVKSVEQVPIRVRRQTGAVNTIGVTQVEHWTYEPGYGRFPALLTFEEGKLKSIEIIAKH